MHKTRQKKPTAAILEQCTCFHRCPVDSSQLPLQVAKPAYCSSQQCGNKICASQIQAHQFSLKLPEAFQTKHPNATVWTFKTTASPVCHSAQRCVLHLADGFHHFLLDALRQMVLVKQLRLTCCQVCFQVEVQEFAALLQLVSCPQHLLDILEILHFRCQAFEILVFSLVSHCQKLVQGAIPLDETRIVH